MKGFKWVFAATLLCAGQASAQSIDPSFTIVDLGEANSTAGISIRSAAIRSKTDHSMELQLSNGVTLVIDDTLNKIFVDNGQGVQEMNLDTALLSWANGDTASANALRERFRNTLNDPTREISLTSDLLAGSNSMWGSDTTCFSADASCGNEAEPYSTSITDFAPRGWGTYTFTFHPHPPGPDDDEDDRRDWERWRNASCEDAASSARNIVLMIGPSIAACGSVALCVVGALAIANELND